MRIHRLLTIVVCGFPLPLPGCGKAHPDATAATAKARQGGESAVVKREELSVEDRLRSIASELHNGGYKIVGGFERAIYSCSDWGRTANFSSASSDTPHGMKIYLPWAKDAHAYFLAAKKNQPTGQIVVKESWIARELGDQEYAESGSTLAERDGKRYKAEKPADLFIMFKSNPRTPDTDEGWVYGVVTPDGKRVSASGRIAVCVDCHRQARHDRVFGEKPNAE